ncbi:S-phase kinase-associated protein 1-like [Rhynchophorus ferrugineus]|uniref:S-phase kinase-associated protein 1-like n=1 Tax=Rhynchophorus ferrugineus TaxID=354439 RepID=UPI003FCE549C
MRLIKLKSCDGVIFEIDFDVVKCSTKIKDFFESENTNDAEERIMHIIYADANLLGKILEWCTFHINDPEPAVYCEDDLSEWDVGFLNDDPHTIVWLTNVAYLLKIKGLFNMIARTVARKGYVTTTVRGL